MLAEEFSALSVTQTALAEKTGLPRRHINEICWDRQILTADTALIFARVSAIPPTSGSTRNAGPTFGLL